MPYLTVECDMRGSIGEGPGAPLQSVAGRWHRLLQVARRVPCVESDSKVLCATEDIWIWYTPHRSQRSSKLSIQAQPDAI